MSPKRRKIFLASSLLVAASALAFVSMSNMEDSLVYYWTASEVQEAGDKAYGATIRLGGVVKKGTKDWNQDTQDLWFEVVDPGVDGKLDTEDDVSLKVHSTDGPPQMFDEGIGVVIEGTLVKGGYFESNRLMVKHSNEYKAPEEGKDAKDLYETVEDM